VVYCTQKRSERSDAIIRSWAARSKPVLLILQR
jgi:hypothetical protein